MSKFYINIIIAVLSSFGLVIFSQPLYSQKAFDSYLEKDSLFRYNASLRSLDSIINNSIVHSVRDTVFYNSYGKAEVITLSQMLYFALNNNPLLKSMQYRIDAETMRSKEYSSLPDPMFEFETDDLASNFKRVGMINFYVSQTFPFPGKLELSRRSVLNNSNVMEQERHDMEVNLINMVKNSFYDLYFLNRKLDINRENQLVVKNFITATESRYSVGKGMQQEVFKSQIELSKLKNEEFLLTQSRKNINSELTSLTKIVIDESTRISYANVDVDYLLNNDSFDSEGMPVNKLVDYAFEHRADLKALGNKILTGKTDLEGSKLSRMPDFSLKLGYKILPFEDKNAFDFMIGVTIPFAPWSSGKYDAMVQKSIINIKASTSDYDTKKNDIRNEIISAYNSLQSGREALRYYYYELIPQTENSLKSTQNSYESDLTSFLDLLDSYKTYQETKLMYYESMNMYLKSITALEKAAGLNLKN